MGTRRAIFILATLAVAVASAVCVGGCSKSQGIGYGTGYTFTYPHGLATSGGWSYRMVVNQLDPGGSSFALTQKGARVSIVNAQGDFLLDESYDFGRRAAIEASVTWSVPETVVLEIREQGFVDEAHPVPDDVYNGELEKAGGRTLRTVTYHLDSSTNRFVVVP